jgi:hypothetical protein
LRRIRRIIKLKLRLHYLHKQKVRRRKASPGSAIKVTSIRAKSTIIRSAIMKILPLKVAKSINIIKGS